LKDTYRSEIDDLRFDTDGRNVLAARLADKCKAFSDLLPMIEDAPEMLAAAFHGGVVIRDIELIQSVLLGRPGTLPTWREVSQGVDVIPELTPLVDAALAADGGDEFLVIMAGLQYLLGQEDDPQIDDNHEPESSDDDDDVLGDGEGFLSEQGFDRRDTE
jgi:hypothetical protein